MMSRNIFLYFFDSHFLIERDVRKFYKYALEEANLATRIAYLISDTVFIPLASYIETDFCRACLNPLMELTKYGEIEFVGKASNMTEYKETKIEEYKFNPDIQKKYIDWDVSNIVIRPKKTSTTKHILSLWNQVSKTGNIDAVCTQINDKNESKKIEKNWEKLPKLIMGKPVIFDNVFPLLAGTNDTRNLRIKNHIYNTINTFYFDSYITDLNAAIFSGMHYLCFNTSNNSNIKSIPYNILARSVKQNGYDKILPSYNCDELFDFKSSDKCKKIIDDALINEVEFHRFYNNGEKNTNTSFQNFYLGDITVGDKYVNNGQAGVVGSGITIANSSFNQVWNDYAETIDYEKLYEELDVLKKHIMGIAKTPEEQVEIGYIAEAQISCKSQLREQLFDKLKKIGKWVFDRACSIGVNVVVDAIKVAAGF